VRILNPLQLRASAAENLALGRIVRGYVDTESFFNGVHLMYGLSKRPSSPMEKKESSLSIRSGLHAVYTGWMIGLERIFRLFFSPLQNLRSA